MEIIFDAVMDFAQEHFLFDEGGTDLIGGEVAIREVMPNGDTEGAAVDVDAGKGNFHGEVRAIGAEMEPIEADALFGIEAGGVFGH